MDSSGDKSVTLDTSNSLHVSSPPSASNAGCPICRKIAKAATETDLSNSDSKIISMGTWQGFLDRKQCVCCQTVVGLLEELDEFQVAFQPLCLLKFEVGTQYFYLYSDSHPQGEQANNHPILELITKQSNDPRYVSVDPARIDVARLVRWTAYCNENHQGSCSDLPHWQIVEKASSLIFIDVLDCCLLEIEPVNCKYVALSYVWGQLPETIELTTANFDRLLVKDSLKQPNFLSLIPKTVADAMVLTGAMGLRYLWVDRLCIIQDDVIHLSIKMQQMASIYANSYFTIIAAAGADANHGLPGVSLNSPRSRVETALEFSNNVCMFKLPVRELKTKKPVWSTRGWTFQERALSPKTIVFLDNIVYWQCRSDIWFENIDAVPDGAKYGIDKLGEFYDEKSQVHLQKLMQWPSYALKLHPWPDIAQYFSLVEGYSSRNLSFESDGLLAFSAIITTMNKSFPGGFHFGLPVFLFDIGIMWSARGPLTRRRGFPSWSWLGWKGPVHLHFGYKKAWQPFYGHAVRIDIRPLVDWYIKDQDGAPSQQIDNSYHLHKVEISDPDFTPPPGWSKTWYKLRPSWNEPLEALRYDGLPNVMFRFPFPIFPTTVKDKLHNSSPLLEIETKSCIFFLGGSCPFTYDSVTLLDVDLHDSKGRWAGVISTLFESQDEYLRDAPCEVIAISQGQDKWDGISKGNDGYFHHHPFEEMSRVEEIKKLPEYSFYNVLWIEWANGIAYRKAIGRIWKTSWDRQEVKRVNVVLG